MSTYAIGDIHGCMDALVRLLQKFEFDPGADRLWLVGDLVNGGPDSLAILRWARELGERASVVLGNHDLHMLAVAAGAQKMRSKDTFEEVLNAPDAAQILEWFRHRSMLVCEGDYVMVHAGLLPQWSLQEAMSVARDIEAAIRAPDHAKFFKDMYGNEPRRWRPGLTGKKRLRLGVNAFTRMRVINHKGALDFKFKGELKDMPEGLQAWFDAPDRETADKTVICGHWSALGLCLRPDLLALDTGCVWGRSLTAVRLEDRALFQVGCKSCG